MATLKADIPAHTGEITGARLWGVAAVALATFGYFLPYWNRFVGVSSGGMPIFLAEQILRGVVPYRDFLLIIPPLHFLKIGLLMQWLGHSVLPLRMEAILERTILAVLVYWWLSRWFRPAACFVGIFLGMALFNSDPADALTAYHHDAVLLSVCAGYCASLVFRTSGRAILPASAAGLFAGLTFLTSQTGGFGITLAIPCAVCALKLRGRDCRGAALFLAAYAAGWLIPIGSLLIWLLHYQMLHEFVHCVFLSGSAKGPLIRVVTRPLFKPWVPVVAVLLGAAGWLANRRRRSDLATGGDALWAWVALAILTIAAAVVAKDRSLSVLGILGRVQTPAFAMALVGSILLALQHGLRFLRTGSREDAGLAVAAATGAAVSYSCALSFAYYGPVAMPGLALVAAYALDRFWPRMPARLLLAVLCFSMTFVEAVYKYEVPFKWLGWAEMTASRPLHRSSLPQLAGLAVPRDTGEIVDQVTALIRTHVPPGGTLFVYPYFPMFNVLSGLPQPTYSLMHYVDVFPDWAAERDTSTLLAHPPSVIVRLSPGSGTLLRDENYYRGSLAGGPRKMEATLDRLSSQYRVLASLLVPGSVDRLEVLAKK